MFRRRGRHLEKNRYEHREYRRLDESDEDFEEEERKRDEIGHQMQHDRQENFPREDIAEQSERERKDLVELRTEFQYAHQRPHHLLLMKMTDAGFLCVPAATERENTGHL